MNSIKTVFLGSNWESLATLEALHNDPRFEIVGVITQPDKPAGRKMILTPTLVKEYALKNDIPVFHTESSEEKYHEAYTLFKPELVVVKAFGEIIPEFFLMDPKYKAINIHFSLLPKYRGAVPIQMAILNGDKTTGITIVQMVAKLDAGPILTTVEEPILDTDTNETLRQRLVKISSEVIGDILENWCAGNIGAVPQDESLVTFCWQRDIAKEKAQIDWESMEPRYIERMVRAFQPWPVAWTEISGKRCKVFEVSIMNASELSLKLKPGEMTSNEQMILVGSNDPEIIIAINDLQIEGGKRMGSKEYLRGTKI